MKMTNAEKEAEEWAKKELGTIRIPLEYKKNLPIFERLEREDKKLKASCKAAFLAGRASAPKIERIGTREDGASWMLKELSRHLMITPEILDLVTIHWQGYLRRLDNEESDK